MTVVMGIAAACVMQLPAFQAHAKTLTYLTLPDTGKIEVIDTATNAVVNTLAFGDSPGALRASRSGRYVYVASSGLLFVIDSAKQAAGTAIAVGQALQVELTPDGTHFYTFNKSGVVIGDATTNVLSDEVSLGNGEWTSMGVARDGTVYVVKRTRVTDMNGVGVIQPVSVLAIIDPVTRAATQVTIPGTNPNTIAFSPSADFGYVLVEDGIEVLDTATNSISKLIPGAKDGPGGDNGLFPPGLPDYTIEVFLRAVFTSDGTRAYVYGGNTNRIVVIDTAQQQQIASIPLSGSFADFALAPDDSRLYVTGGIPGLTVIDTATNQVIGTGLQDTDTSNAQIAIVSVPDTPCAPDIARCAALMCTGDGNGDGAVTINEIMTAVNNGLSGCPVPPQ